MYRRRVACVLLAVLTVLSAGLPAHARPDDPHEDKKRVDAELARTGALLEVASAKARTAAGALTEVNSAMPAAQARVIQARGDMIAARAQAETAQRAADAARAAYELADEQLQAAAAGVEQGRAGFAEFAVATYKGSELVQFNMMLGSRGPSEVATRTGYLRTIASVKRQAVDRLLAARRSAKETAYAAVQARRAADESFRVAKESLAVADAARLEAERAQQDLAALAERKKAALAQAEDEREDMMRRYEDLKKDSKQIEDELKAWEAGKAADPSRSDDAVAGRPPLKAGARLLMPAKGWKSSDFGNRYDPYYNVWQLHAGVDIAADGGDPIHAAEDGEVASAGWNGGYGNYTCVYHGQGKGMSTCYAHQSRILVKVGQKVRRGQVIGRVGTTGASTGNHLHFEVRLNGTPKNPLPYLPGCFC